MSLITVLNKKEAAEFEQIPKFDEADRKEFFVEQFERGRSFRNDNGLVCYYLLNGYFIATGRMYSPEKFHKADIEFLTDEFNLDKDLVKPSKLPASTLKLFKTEILQKRGCIPFTNFEKSLIKEAGRLIQTSLKPKQVLFELIAFLKQNKVEIPSYHFFANCITNTLREFENALHNRLDELLSEEQKNELDRILRLPKNPSKEISPSNPYLLTTIKNPEQSLSPRKIKESLKDFALVSDIYTQFSGILSKLEISDSLINYYALWLTKSRHVTFLAISEPSKKFIYLLSFVAYQYRIRQDYFVDTLLKSVTEFVNKTKKTAANDFLNQRPIKLHQTKKIIGIAKSLNTHVETIRNVVYSEGIDDRRKIKELKSVFGEMAKSKEEQIRSQEALQKEIQNLEANLSSDLRESFIIEGYVSGHRRLMNRTSGIVQVLDFNPDTSDLRLIDAINCFKNRGSGKKRKWPENLFNSKQIKCLKEIEKEWYPKLYEVFLSIEVADKLNSGSLNLKNSERYRAIEEYLISEEDWKSSKDQLINKAELDIERKFEDNFGQLRLKLFEQYTLTNENAPQNKYLNFGPNGKIKLVTPKKNLEEEAADGILNLLEKDELTSLVKVLADVQETVDFMSSFSHFSKKYHKSEKPSIETFIAGIIALGCNIGPRRMAKISHGISYEKLSDLIQWYFSKENVDSASQLIIEAIDKLSLPSLYQKKPGTHHTSSDGQKFNVSVPSLMASHSHKYHGTGKGVTALSFIDEFSRLYYSMVMDSAERESTYTIDGLINDDTVESEKHSTDTHGYTEIVFGLSYALGVQFSPRIKNIKDQIIYTFRSHPKKYYESKGYQMLPRAKSYLNEGIIEKHWDSILRILVTIKLRVTRASTILKRLSAYSKQHELHKALKEFGRIYKSKFILKYVDDVDLRQDTEKAENRIEQSHQFAKAIFFGGNQKLKYGTKEEQELAISCRHLIQNSIVFWNYMTLTDMLIEIQDDRDLYEKVKETIKNASVMTWRHINIHGEYDFEMKNEEQLFEIERLIDFKLN